MDASWCPHPLNRYSFFAWFAWVGGGLCWTYWRQFLRRHCADLQVAAAVLNFWPSYRQLRRCTRFLWWSWHACSWAAARSVRFGIVYGVSFWSWEHLLPALRWSFYWWGYCPTWQSLTRSDWGSHRVDHLQLLLKCGRFSRCESCAGINFTIAAAARSSLTDSDSAYLHFRHSSKLSIMCFFEADQHLFLRSIWLGFWKPSSCEGSWIDLSCFSCAVHREAIVLFEFSVFLQEYCLCYEGQSSWLHYSSCNF